MPDVRKIKMALPNVAGYVFDSKVGSGTFADVYKAFKNSHVRCDFLSLIPNQFFKIKLFLVSD